MSRPPLTHIGHLVGALVNDLKSPANTTAAQLGLKRHLYQALLQGTLVITLPLAQRLERLAYSTQGQNSLTAQDWLELQQQYHQDEENRYQTKPNQQPPNLTNPNKWKRN